MKANTLGSLSSFSAASDPFNWSTVLPITAARSPVSNQTRALSSFAAGHEGTPPFPLLLFSSLSLVISEVPAQKRAELTAFLSEEGRRRAVPRRGSAGTDAEVNAGRTASEVGPSQRSQKARGRLHGFARAWGLRPNRTGTTTPKMLRRFGRSSRKLPHLMTFVLSGWP